MRLRQLIEITKQQVDMMPIEDRQMWLEFIYHWLSGSYMKIQPKDILDKWKQLARMFPPKVPSIVTLYRVVTLPMQYNGHKSITFKPAPNTVSSWTKTVIGLDSVVGISNELTNDIRNTIRVAIKTSISGKNVLATHLSIRDAFITLSHDYFDKYPEVNYTTTKETQTIHHTDWPGYPGKDELFDMYEVGFLRDVLNRPGGYYRQYEYIVETPEIIDAQIIQTYRIGDDTIKYGNDDPHNFSFKRRKNFK